MKNKTCGECRFYHPILKHEGVCTATSDLRKTCDFTTACAIGGVYTKPPLTNGDVIRQMSNEEFRDWYCKQIHMAVALLVNPMDAQYRHNVLAWLNAPAESEGEDE